jgi:hypothetical protein
VCACVCMTEGVPQHACNHHELLYKYTHTYTHTAYAPLAMLDRVTDVDKLYLPATDFDVYRCVCVCVYRCVCVSVYACRCVCVVYNSGYVVYKYICTNTPYSRKHTHTVTTPLLLALKRPNELPPGAMIMTHSRT